MVGLLSKPCASFGKILQNRFNPFIIRYARQHNEKKQLKLSRYDEQNYLNKKGSKRDVGGYAVFTLMFPLTCFGLAIWQYKRKSWKELLMKDMEMKTFIPAVDLPQDLTNKRKLEYRRVKVRGTFDHSREIYISPRSYIENNEFPKDESGFSPFSNNETKIGAIVVTPFKLADRDLTILVNRGWVPHSKLDPKTRPEGQIEGEVEIEGIIRSQEEKPFVGGEHDIRKRLFKYRDIEEMAELANSSYLYIDAVEQTTVPGGPIGGQTQVKLRNEHLQYMITWLTVGAFLGHMWHKRWIRRLN